MQPFKKSKKKKDPMRYIFSSGLFFSLLGLVLLFGLVLVLTNDDLHLMALVQRAQHAQENAADQAKTASWQTAEGDEYSLTIDEQDPGENVMVDELNFAKDAWVVFHADDNGNPGVILSAYRFNTGKIKNWDVELIDGVALEAGKTYHAMIHEQNGDRGFDYTVDTPLLDENGQPMVVPFAVRAE